MTLSLLYNIIIAITLALGLSRAVKPEQGHRMLCADGIVQPCPTFDMLVSSDVGYLYGLTD